MRRLLSKFIEYQKGSNFVAIQKPSWITPSQRKKRLHIHAGVAIILVASEEYLPGNYYEAEQGERAFIQYLILPLPEASL